MHAAQVGVDDLAGGAQLLHPAVVEKGDAVAHVAHRAEGVRHDHDRLALVLELGELLVALALELLVAHGEDLVDQKDVGIDVDGDREPQPDVHARRVVLDRGVDEPLQPGEADDVVEDAVEVSLPEAEDRAVEVDVLSPGQLRVEAGAEFEQSGHLAGDADATAVGPEDLGDAFQQRALPRPVLTDQAERLAFLHLEGDVTQGPELLERRPAPTHHPDLQGLVALVVQPEAL